DAVRTAEAFKQHLCDAVAAGPRNPARNELINALVADNAPFALSDAELKERLSDDKRRHMDRLQTALADLKKNAPPAPPMTHGLSEGAPGDLHVYVRGNP